MNSRVKYLYGNHDGSARGGGDSGGGLGGGGDGGGGLGGGGEGGGDGGGEGGGGLGGGGADGGEQYCRCADLPTTRSMCPSLFTSSAVRLVTSSTPKGTMPSLALPAPPVGTTPRWSPHQPLSSIADEMRPPVWPDAVGSAMLGSI